MAAARAALASIIRREHLRLGLDLLVLGGVVTASVWYGVAGSLGAQLAAVSLTGFAAFGLALRARSEQRLSGRVRALTRRNSHIGTALDSMSQGLCMFDAEKRLIVCNERYAELYRLAPELMQPGTPFRK